MSVYIQDARIERTLRAEPDEISLCCPACGEAPRHCDCPPLSTLWAHFKKGQQTFTIKEGHQ